MTAHTDPVMPASAASRVVIVLTTLPSDADAAAFAEALVTERLAACVSMGAEMTSVYAWKGAIERTRERQVLVKTVTANVPLIKARLATLHPYNLPELLVLAVDDGGEAYLAWVRESASG